MKKKKKTTPTFFFEDQWAVSKTCLDEVQQENVFFGNPAMEIRLTFHFFEVSLCECASVCVFCHLPPTRLVFLLKQFTSPELQRQELPRQLWILRLLQHLDNFPSISFKNKRNPKWVTKSHDVLSFGLQSLVHFRYRSISFLSPFCKCSQVLHWTWEKSAS